MRTNTDISFNDKKQLNNKPNPTSKGSLTPNEEPRSNKSIDRVEETIQNKAANQQIIEKPKTA